MASTEYPYFQVIATDVQDYSGAADFKTDAVHVDATAIDVVTTWVVQSQEATGYSGNATWTLEFSLTGGNSDDEWAVLNDDTTKDIEVGDGLISSNRKPQKGYYRIVYTANTATGNITLTHSLPSE